MHQTRSLDETLVSTAVSQALEDAIAKAKIIQAQPINDIALQLATIELNNAVATFKASIVKGTELDITALETTITAAANLLKGDYETTNQPAEEVDAGQKFTTSDSENDLEDAIDVAEDAAKTVDSVEALNAAIGVLTAAMKKFEASMMMGTFVDVSRLVDDIEDARQKPDGILVKDLTADQVSSEFEFVTSNDLNTFLEAIITAESVAAQYSSKAFIEQEIAKLSDPGRCI